MNDYKTITEKHFNKKIEEYKNGPQAVSWGSKKSQVSRFKVLSEIGNLNGKKILDVGCGMGDFYSYLISKNVKPKSYTGVDMVSKMVDGAKRKHPKATFALMDLCREIPKEKFDYVFESGIFNLKVSDWDKTTHKILENMFKAAKAGIAVNFLSVFSPFEKDKSSHYEDPFKITRFVSEKLSRNFILRHDYRPNDFTVYIFKK